MTPKAKIIIGSTRPGRVGPKVAQWVEAAAKAHGKFDVELVDLAALNIPLLDEAAHPALQKYEHEHSRSWSRTVDSADAFIFVTPEYDYFPPAALVNAIQIVLREWGYKPASVISYGGISGGLRSSQALRQLLANVNVHALPQGVPVPMVAQFIGEDGVFRANDLMTEGLAGQLDELFKWATALMKLREGQKQGPKTA